MEGSQGNSEVAVIGARVAGSICALLLAAKGLPVKVFDSGRGPSGRMSQRREKVEDGSELMFDHGAQYFTVKSAEVQQVNEWQASGIVVAWEGRFGSLNVANGDFVEETAVKTRYVGVPGMNSICKALTSSPGVQAKYGVQVGGLEWADEGVWCLKTKDGKQLGKFNVVVVADKGAAKLLLGENSSRGWQGWLRSNLGTSSKRMPSKRMPAVSLASVKNPKPLTIKTIGVGEEEAEDDKLSGSNPAKCGITVLIISFPSCGKCKVGTINSSLSSKLARA